MELSLYKYLFALALIIFAIAFLYSKNKDFQILFSIFSLVLFMALTMQSLNIEIITFDGTNWQTQRITDYYLPLGVSFIFTVINTLYSLLLLWDYINIFKRTNKYKIDVKY